MKRVLWFIGSIASIVLILAVAGTSGQLAKEGVKHALDSHNASKIKDQIADIQFRAAEAIRKQSPIAIDQNTTLYTAMSAGGQLIYMYQIAHNAADIDTAVFINTMKPILLQSACTQEGMRLAMSYGGSYRYSYKGADGIFIADIVIDSKDCE